MSETLSKEQVEAIRQVACETAERLIKHDDAVGNLGPYIKAQKEKIALCDLASQAIDMRPRPLSDIDKTDMALVVATDSGGTRHLSLLRCYGSGVWKTGAIGKPWPDTTLAIPLSALPTGVET